MDRAGTPLFYVVDWLPPDFGAVGQYGAILAREIALGGRSVKLIGLTTGAGRATAETVSGGAALETVYVHAAAYEKSDLRKRLLWSIRTNLRLVREVARDRRSHKADILFTGAPPFMLFFVVALKWLRKARLTYRITDFYPEVLIAGLGRRRWLVAAERLTWLVRRRIDRFEVLGEDQRARLVAGGIAPDRISLRRDPSPVAIAEDTHPAPRPAALNGHKILLYSGNYGVAHDTETVIAGLIRHHRDGSGRFGLWLNATGGKADIVEQRLREAGVPVARSAPVPLDRLAGLLVAADAHLIALRPQFSGIVLPSKVYACIASRRPVLFVGPASSDVHLLCRKAELPAYERVEPGDLAGFALALARLARCRDQQG